MKQVQLTLTLEQAQAVAKGLDLYTRLCCGQLNQVAEMVSTGEIPLLTTGGEARRSADLDSCDQFGALMDAAKNVIGYPRNGSMGIGHPHVALPARRSWEVLKVLQQALAIDRDPEPHFRGVQYDGLSVRYTKDPVPVVNVVE